MESERMGDGIVDKYHPKIKSAKIKLNARTLMARCWVMLKGTVLETIYDEFLCT